MKVFWDETFRLIYLLLKGCDTMTLQKRVLNLSSVNLS